MTSLALHKKCALGYNNKPPKYELNWHQWRKLSYKLLISSNWEEESALFSVAGLNVAGNLCKQEVCQYLLAFKAGMLGYFMLY